MFQPTRPHGARRLIQSVKVMSKTFQPTRPHGARLLFKVLPLAVPCFNPRARMGRDLQQRNIVAPHIVSTHAPAWGATDNYLPYCLDNVFQPTRPHGARLSDSYELDQLGKFQPTRPHGARLPISLILIGSKRFQPTRPHGARLRLL